MERGHLREQEMLDLVDRVYAAAADPGTWNDTLQALAEAFGGVGATMILHAVDAADVAAVSPALRAAVPDYVAHWCRHDSIGAEAFRSRLKGVFSDLDIFSAETFRADPFYQEFRRDHGMRHLLCLVAATAEGDRLTVSIQFPTDVEEIDRARRVDFERLSRHLSRAMLLTTRLGGLATAGNELAEALGRLGFGAAVLDGRGAVLVANAAFERLTAGHLALARPKPRFRAAAVQTAFEAMVADALARTASGHPDFLALPRPDSRMPVYLRVVPLPRPGDGDPRRRHVLVMVTDPLEGGGAVAAALMQAGLTAGEARVAELVGGGLMPARAAEELSLSEETVRTVLKKVFAKLDVGRQGELVRLVERITPLFRL